MHTQLEHWRVLDTVVRLGGVLPAAQHLHRSQSAISYTLKQLEEQSGLALMELRGRKLHLTPAGTQLLQEARHILRQMTLLDQQIGLLAQGIESTLTLAVEQIVPHETLLQALAALHQRYPHLNLHWHDIILSEADSAISSTQADLIIAAHVPVNLTGLPWQAVELIAVAASHHPLAQAQRLTLDDLTQHTQLVIRDHGQGQRESGWLASPRRWTLDHLQLQQHLTEQGLGYAWLPRHRIATALEQGRLTALPLNEGAILPLQTYLIANPEKPAGDILNALIQRLQTSA